MMAYTEILQDRGSKITPFLKSEGMHWDIAISCYEPLEMVTGGIGTYTRLLTEILANSPTLEGRNIALFCRTAASGLKGATLNKFRVFEIADDREIYRKPVERLGNEHDWFSWNLAHQLLDLTKRGHSFGFFEFSDYAVEAYFSLKMRRAGLLDIGTIGVRLHSPELMLFRDNQLPARAYDPERLTRISRELFCYQHCDRVLYGAPAMLQRVAQECRRFGVEIETKSAHVEHPYPVHDTSNTKVHADKRAAIHIGYVGRLETRKGILSFLRIISGNERLLRLIVDLDIVFELFGADCTDQNHASIRSQILALHRIPELRGRIIVHGYMAQANLNERLKDLDGFVFPSLFENYPNALLEVLHTAAPILISEAGGMPYISRGLPGIYQFSYNHDTVQHIAEFLCSIRSVKQRKPMFFDMASRINGLIAASYADLAGDRPLVTKSPGAARTDTPLRVDFVVPFYNDAEHITESLKSLKNVMGMQDNLYIIDDVSHPEEFSKLEKIVMTLFGNDNRVLVHRMPVNSGPSAVRNVGARLGNNPIIQFLDADDHLGAVGFDVTKSYITRNVDVDFVYGVQDNFGAKSHVWVPRDSSVMTCLDENYAHSAILIKRNVFEDSGGFDDEMRLHFEDWQFNCKLAFSGYRGEVVPFVTQHYRVREGSRTFRNLEREAFSREQVIDRSCMNRKPQESMLQGEMLELIGKYSSYINGQWRGGDSLRVSEEPVITKMTLDDLCKLEGEEFVRAAYGVVLGRRADDAGLRFYADRLNQGISTRNIVADMLVSAEMRGKRRVAPKEYYSSLRFKRLARHPVLKKYVLRNFG